MFHGVEVTNPQSIFKFLPVLSFTESYIYQLDIINEKSLQFSMDKLSTSGNYVHVGTQGDVTHVPPAFLSNPFDPLLFLLQQHGLLTKRIEEELKSGLEYWALERSLCHALISKEKILLEDVMRAIHLKSFDYRVLHLLLYQLRDEQVNELHMEFLSVSEFLVEISDDLYDYEDDVIENCFNVLRMLVGVYGPQMAPSILAKCISEAEEKYNLLFRSLDYGISSNYQRRCEEATREGGKTSGYTLGTWNIPCVVVDEDAYRSRNLNSNGPRHKPNHGFPTV
uniref:Regulatory protein recX n=2 Tax=Anthurium amnicola TaxID=1678845 RepID=A0A1D1YAB2_9ARAE